MSDLGPLIADYLIVRRSLGFTLEKNERFLTQFHQYLQHNSLSVVTTQVMVDWAALPDASPAWHSARLNVLRVFARWAHVFDPTIDVPPVGLLPKHAQRRIAFVYSPDEIVALMEVTSTMSSPLLAATYRTLIGLLAATGMRVGEVIHLDRSDLSDGVVTIRDTKFGKTRLVPLHPTTIQALADYARLRENALGDVATDAFFVSTAGTRLIYRNVHFFFHQLIARAGILPRSSQCHPRPHDLRHTFAINTMLDAYRRGDNAAEVLPILSTYLGHASPASTYWYLQADPTLLAAAAQLRPALGEVAPVLS